MVLPTAEERSGQQKALVRIDAKQGFFGGGSGFDLSFAVSSEEDPVVDILAGFYLYWRTDVSIRLKAV